MTGKNERAYSTMTGSRTLSGATPPSAASRMRFGFQSQASKAQMMPVMNDATTRMNEKSNTMADYFSLPT
jgi:hypothetical protein